MTRKNDPYGTCRQCGGRVLWVKTKAGKNMPVNPILHNFELDPSGKERLVTSDGEVVAGRIVRGKPGDGVGYISHFATCPCAGKSRKR